MSEQQNCLAELIAEMKAQTKSSLELAASIRLQSAAIDDLVELLSRSEEDGNTWLSVGHLGEL